VEYIRTHQGDNGLYKTELIKLNRPWQMVEEVELATAEWVGVQPQTPL
jgi:hypothetical protein